jgi:hypothetical protein
MKVEVVGNGASIPNFLLGIPCIKVFLIFLHTRTQYRARMSDARRVPLPRWYGLTSCNEDPTV